MCRLLQQLPLLLGSHSGAGAGFYSKWHVCLIPGATTHSQNVLVLPDGQSEASPIVTTQTILQEPCCSGLSACLCLVFRALFPRVKPVGEQKCMLTPLGGQAPNVGRYRAEGSLSAQAQPNPVAHIPHVTAGRTAVSRKSIVKTAECQWLTHWRPSREQIKL